MADLERSRGQELVEPLRGLVSAAMERLDSTVANIRLNRRVMALEASDRLYLLTDSHASGPTNRLHIYWIKTRQDIPFRDRIGSINLPVDEARMERDNLSSLKEIDPEAIRALKTQIESGKSVSTKNYSEELKRAIVLQNHPEVSPK